MAHPDLQESAGGHYVTSGAAIVGMGFFGLFMAAVILNTAPHVFGFIDEQAMVAISTMFVVVGGAMIRHGRR